MVFILKINLMIIIIYIQFSEIRISVCSPIIQYERVDSFYFYFFLYQYRIESMIQENKAIIYHAKKLLFFLLRKFIFLY